MAAAAGGPAAVTARRVAETAARIFGNVLGDGLRSGRKYLQKALVGDKVKNYYPQFSQFATTYDPMFDDPDEKHRKLKLERLKRRGKGPPKKGEGKRASKR